MAYNWVLSLILFILPLSGANANECGVVKRLQNSSSDQIYPGKWPFVAALYSINTLNFVCAATIISPKHVLTAAHCVHDKSSGRKIVPVDAVVALGKFNLSSSENDNREFLSRKVKKITLHPDWKTTDNNDSDLAILTMSEEITFSDFIQPICLPAENQIPEHGKGVVVGWGLTKISGKESDIQQDISAAISNDSNCNTNASHTNQKTFCAGSLDGSNSVNSLGGGFYILSNSSWTLYGIASTSDKTNPSGSPFSVHTNIVFYRDWIKNETVTVNEAPTPTTASEQVAISPALDETTQLSCNFELPRLYVCAVDTIDIENEHVKVSSVAGDHVDGLAESDVHIVEFRDGYLKHIPNGIGNLFPNLLAIQFVKRSFPLGLKSLKRNYFENMKNLLRVTVFDESIESVDADAFYDLPNLATFELERSALRVLEKDLLRRNTQLESISVIQSQLGNLHAQLFQYSPSLEKAYFRSNKITQLEQGLFNDNPSLKEVTFAENQIKVLPKDLFQNNPSLVGVNFASNQLTELDSHFFAKNPLLREVYFPANNLTTVPQNFFENNPSLELVVLASNNIVELHQDLFNNNRLLKEVYLTENQLTEIPSLLFQNSSSLKSVYFGSNKLTEINSTTFWNCPSLSTVYIQTNKLTRLPPNLFSYSPSLDTVNFGTNNITELQSDLFKSNPSVTQVAFPFNQIKKLPEDLFQSNPCLEFVNFASNKIGELPSELFKGNPLLKEVYFTLNKISRIPTDFFENNPSLESVGFAGNILIRLNQGLFQHNPSLENVYFARNLITQLPRDLFINTPNLKEVDFGTNKLTTLPEHLFIHSPRLEKVYFSNNLIFQISTDFTKLSRATAIAFKGNLCIDENFDVGSLESLKKIISSECRSLL